MIKTKEDMLKMLKFMSKKGITFTLMAILLMGVVAGCAKKEDPKNAATATPSASPSASATATATPAPAKTELTGTVTASGSSALLPLVKQAATDFMTLNPKVTVTVTAGGSGTGVKNVA